MLNSLGKLASKNFRDKMDKNIAQGAIGVEWKLGARLKTAEDS